MRIVTASILSALAGAALLAGCASTPPAPVASATLAPTKGSTVSGTVNFSPTGDKVLVTAEVRGLKPNSEHGFHIHEKGDCSAPDAMSAGGHFNPAGAPHAHHGQAARHAGDLPNLKSDAAGNAVWRFETDLVSLAKGAANDITGRSVVIHANPDDYASQPAGNSGPRVACGVIGAAR